MMARPGHLDAMGVPDRNSLWTASRDWEVREGSLPTTVILEEAAP